jgi:uncharacterized protein GlcG (DUF336 family)
MRRSLIALVALAALFLPARAQAQLRQVAMVGAEGAKRALVAAEQEARKQGWNVSIAVVDPAGELVGFLRMDGAPQASVDIARGKARTAARFRRPTKALEEIVAGGRVAAVTFEGMVLIEGGVPITVDGVVVGAVGVSGASSAQDAQVAQAAANAVTR